MFNQCDCETANSFGDYIFSRIANRELLRVYLPVFHVGDWEIRSQAYLNSHFKFYLRKYHFINFKGVCYETCYQNPEIQCCNGRL
jgi:hypothetical protein